MTPTSRISQLRLFEPRAQYPAHPLPPPAAGQAQSSPGAGAGVLAGQPMLGVGWAGFILVPLALFYEPSPPLPLQADPFNQPPQHRHPHAPVSFLAKQRRGAYEIAWDTSRPPSWPGPSCGLDGHTAPSAKTPRPRNLASAPHISP